MGTIGIPPKSACTQTQAATINVEMSYLTEEAAK